MKKGVVIPWILCGVLLVAALFGWLRPRGTTTPYNTLTDTIIVNDTIIDSIPIPQKVYLTRYDTLFMPINSTDTIRDSIYVTLPIERKEYKTEDYYALVSGWHPSLDKIEVYKKTQTITIHPKPKRFGVGIQAGVGYPSGWYVGVGISYDIWQF